MIDLAKHEQQLRFLVQSGTNTVQHGGHMFAHAGPVGTVAVELDILGLGKQSRGGIGNDLHDLGGKLSLQQFQYGTNLTGALFAYFFPPGRR